MNTGSLVEEIKARLDIVDLISAFVQLKKSGQNWKGLCPFHSEKTPSFTVNEAKQIFHCFGCGAGGDVISFVEKYENLPFIDALKLLAEKAGIAMPEARAGGRAAGREEKLRGALDAARGYFIKNLPDAPAAMAYLRRRGISAESIELFGIGFAPGGWNGLLSHLRKLGFSDQTIREAGLAATGDRGLYDMFRQRIIFPIAGPGGATIAFGGRALGDSLPKYLNSPETQVFKKSSTLFGLSLAKDEIRREKTVLIVEGYLDVVICHQYGFRNAVAPLGTALTAGHVQRLRPLASTAVLVFDGDAAGKAAARRSLPLICRAGFRTRVLLLPDGEDPDSFLRRHGSGPLRGLVEGAQTVVRFLLGTAQGEKSDAVRETLSLISVLEDQLAAEEMIRELSERAGVHEGAIREELRRTRRTAGRAAPKPVTAAPAQLSGTSEEYLLLGAIISCPEKAEAVLSRLDLADVKDPSVASLFRRFASSGGRGPSADVREATEEERALLTKFSVNPGLDVDSVDQSIEECLRRIEKRKLDERMREIRNQIGAVEKAGNFELVNSLHREMHLLREKHRSIEDGGL